MSKLCTCNDGILGLSLEKCIVGLSGGVEDFIKLLMPSSLENRELLSEDISFSSAFKKSEHCEKIWSNRNVYWVTTMGNYATL